MAYQLLLKPTYSNQLRTVATSDLHLVLEKQNLLVQNPKPDSKNKKRLQGTKEPVFRIRAGNYRILYTFSEAEGWVSLLTVDQRDEVYDDVTNLAVERPTFDFSALPTEEEALATVDPAEPRKPAPTAPESSTFERPIDEALMEQLKILDKHKPALRRCKTLDDLVAAYIPDDVRERVFDAVSSPPIEQVLDQPNLVVFDADDLIRYHRGELLDFLLQLDPDQKRYVTRSIAGSGPVLIKGGPGTGKSTIAMYRVKEVLALLRKQAMQPSLIEEPREESPRMLFTTYTNALINSSRQLLGQLLGSDADLVTVITADAIAKRIVDISGLTRSICLEADLRECYNRAVARFKRDEPRLSTMMLDQLRARFSDQYLREEIEDVIVGRNIRDLDAWKQATRTGRKSALPASSRIAVWRLHEMLAQELDRQKLTTWARLRQQAADLVENGTVAERWDAIFIDEAQDLHPNSLRMLTGLCVSPDRLLLTADANQSIYGSGFNWSDVHEKLQFRGRTGVLRKNYRSTRQISEAAADYLRDAGLDPDRSIDAHVTTGPEPVVRFVEPAAQAPIIDSFFRLATREFRFGFGACAVMVPSESAGHELESALNERGLDARFMAGRSLDLKHPAIKIITYHSAKGLEFPIVAIAGLDHIYQTRSGDAEERSEADLRERRRLFVAMTRAMRGLLLLGPKDQASPLFGGFSPSYWNLESPE